MDTEYYWIFRLDWVYIDSIIIILLIVLLIGVKIFKLGFRWRSSFSNEGIIQLNFKISDNILKGTKIKVKKWNLVKKTNLLEKSQSIPLIVIIRTNYKKRLVHILTEGIVSNGFNVLNLKLKISLCSSCGLLDALKPEEKKKIINSIQNFLKEQGMFLNSTYYIINCSKSFLSLNPLISDSNNKGMILINPHINFVNQKKILEILKLRDLTPTLHFIFSKKSNIVKSNKNLKRFKAKFSKFSPDLLVIERSTRSFKYYETILLGVLIPILNKILTKS